jgi:hypothetical protein
MEVQHTKKWLMMIAPASPARHELPTHFTGNFQIVTLQF